MPAVRRFLARRHLATLLCMATLLLKLLIPTGYMIGSEGGRVSIELCSGVASLPMAMPGMAGDMHDHGRSKHHGKAEMPCAFAGLSAAALGAVGPVQLAALVAFIMAVWRCPILPSALVERTCPRPPPRGPPALL